MYQSKSESKKAGDSYISYLQHSYKCPSVHVHTYVVTPCWKRSDLVRDECWVPMLDIWEPTTVVAASEDLSRQKKDQSEVEGSI